MKEPGLDNHHRDKNGEISRNTLISALRKQYGANFALGFKDTDKLSDALAKLDEPSPSEFIKYYQAKTVAGGIASRS